MYSSGSSGGVTPPRENSDSDRLGTQSESGYTSPDKSPSPELPGVPVLERVRKRVEDDELFDRLERSVNSLKEMIRFCIEIRKPMSSFVMRDVEEYWTRLARMDPIGHFLKRDRVLEDVFVEICAALADELGKIKNSLATRKDCLQVVAPLLKSLKKWGIAAPTISQDSFGLMMENTDIREVAYGDGFALNLVQVGFEAADDARCKQILAILDQKRVLYQLHIVDFSVTPPKAPKEAWFLACLKQTQLPFMQINDEPFTLGFEAMLATIEERFPDPDE